MSAAHTNKTSRVDSPCNCVCNDTWRTSRDRNYQDIGFCRYRATQTEYDLDEDQLIDTLVGDCDKIRDILLCHCEAEKMIILVTGSAAVGSYKYLGIVYNIRNMISSMIAESESDYTLCSYCHRIKPCRGPNNICTECINQMRVSASLD